MRIIVSDPIIDSTWAEKDKYHWLLILFWLADLFQLHHSINNSRPDYSPLTSFAGRLARIGIWLATFIHGTHRSHGWRARRGTSTPPKQFEYRRSIALMTFFGHVVPNVVHHDQCLCTRRWKWKRISLGTGLSMCRQNQVQSNVIDTNEDRQLLRSFKRQNCWLITRDVRGKLFSSHWKKRRKRSNFLLFVWWKRTLEAMSADEIPW